MHVSVFSYRLIPGDLCQGGQESLYQPDLVPCPIKVEDEFILFAERDKISHLSLTSDYESATEEAFPLPKLENVIAVEYDILNSTLYWADIETDKIMVRSIFDK